jgi:hypothetical protein
MNMGYTWPNAKFKRDLNRARDGAYLDFVLQLKQVTDAEWIIVLRGCVYVGESAKQQQKDRRGRKKKNRLLL